MFNELKNIISENRGDFIGLAIIGVIYLGLIVSAISFERHLIEIENDCYYTYYGDTAFKDWNRVEECIAEHKRDHKGNY